MPHHRSLRIRFPQILVGLGCLLLLAGVSSGEDTTTKRPNVVFFLVDDLGHSDLGCYGSTFYKTPHIDKLAASGMRFTNGYAACPVCSPTRASILTGRHPVRVDITDWIPGMAASRHPNPRFLHVDDRDNLALEEVTLAEALKAYRYDTFFAGKWHLGDEGHWPTDQGFDVNVGGNSKGSPPGGYYSPWKNPTLTAKSKSEYLTERLTDESLKFLKTHDGENPFLLYLAYYNVHTPITPYKKRVAEYRQAAEKFETPTPTEQERRAVTRLRQDNPEYASMVAAVDDSVGQILGKLEELELDDNTIVCFFSDNGGLSTVRRMGPTANLGLRAGKGWLYEGGIREPMIVRAPGVTKPGSVSTTPAVSMDFFPTILDLAGLSLQPNLHSDGESLKPLLTGDVSEGEPRAFYWHYPHYHGSTWTPGAAIRQGDWKLIEFYHLQETELYNLADDPREANDLAGKHPDKVRELQAKLKAWQLELGAKMPLPNPDFDPAGN